LIKFFSDIKAINPLALLGFLICVRVFFLIGYLGDIAWQPTAQNYTDFIFSILNQNQYVAFLLSTGIVYLSALFLNNMMVQHEILFRRNFLGAYFFCLIASIYPEYYLLGSPILVTFLMIISMQKLFELYKVPYPFDNIFLTGILTGFCVLLNLSFIVMLVFMLIGIMFFRAIKFKEIMAALLGFALPIFIAFVLNYLLNDVFFPEYLNFPSFDTKNILFQILYSPFPYITLIAVLASIRIVSNYWRNTIKTRRIIILIYFYLAIALLLTFTGNENPLQESLLCALPLSIILAHYYTVDNQLKWYRKLMHILLLVIVFVFQFKFLWIGLI